ncbi:hypothetical protein [Allorhodopirellula heiligendammensis]|uniref:Uncharacterized protein n=1 Tax=Allorhodopirellula heiligendammensis TaxID=2714739 RepID=A0A5C6BIB8_9BACT|nr:hypothetical protein [Allorhodopirellula heiligendammensis]TWU10194.1 hypothetical protein Poly21_51640 [Allorhodopirellula heiligendammensis]
MAGPPNPYQTSSAIEDSDPHVENSLGKPMASFVGVLLGGISAGLIAEMLALITIVLPMNNLTSLSGTFYAFLLISMPPTASLCGALAGITVGCLHDHPLRWLMGLVVGALPVAIVSSQAYDSILADDGELTLIPIILVSVIMLTATFAAVFFVSRVLESVEQQRTTGRVDAKS